MGEIIAVAEFYQNASKRENDRLRRRIQGASLRANEVNEQNLRRISAEFHEGPAHALPLGGLTRGVETGRRDAGIDAIRTSLDAALRDIRQLDP